MRRLSLLRVPGVLCAVLVFSSLAPAGAQTLPEVRTGLGRLEAAAGAPVKSTVSPDTGLVTFLAMEARSPVAVAGARDTSPEAIALAFLQTHGSVFGLGSAATEVELARPAERDELGMDHVRFRQVVRGVPITAGELTVHLRGSDVLAVNAETLPRAETVDTEPTVSPDTALETARELVSIRLHRDDAELSEPRLEILNRGLLEGGRQPSRLAWFVEARALALRQYIWIDADTGNLLLHFSQLADAKNRLIYNGNNTNVLPGTLMRSEGQAATGDAEANRAYDYSGDTYDYFSSQHQRDSFDGAGATLISTVHHCDGGCPYANAFWDGVQMVYGEGYAAADDVVAHELTHAVTERTANLFYYMQSGALNESFSDMFGETVDLTNAGGTDTPAVRWKMGEDIPGGGAIRDMANPGLFFDPGRVTDPNYYCSSADNGGVHINSGVPNHLYALLADGGTYNSVTVTGIGLTKAGKIAYRALTSYLLSGSGFSAAADALKQSCADLVGTAGITVADCTQVQQAINAVALTADLSCTDAPSQGPALCPAGQRASNLLFDDIETLPNVNWTVGASTLWSIVTGYSTSGTLSLYGLDPSNARDSSITMAANLALPAGARLRFNHSYDFDVVYDGGMVEYSLNNGASWSDAISGGAALPVTGASYDGTLATGYGNPLGGRNAFTWRSHGYTGTQLDLASLAGQNVKFRFRIGTDSSFAGFGWLIDDFRIYTCASCTYSLTHSMGFVGAGGGSGTLDMVTQAGCTWNASTAAGWLTLAQVGVGSGKAGFTAAPNTTGSPRSATITAAGQTFTVYQGAATDFHTVSPCRVFNTQTTTPLSNGVVRSFNVAGTCGIPSTAKAVAANITALGSIANGNLTFYPGGVAKPSASTINFSAGAIRANNAILLLAPDGSGSLQVSPFVVGGGTVNAILDVTGYFE